MQTKPFSDIVFNQYLEQEKLMGCRCTQCGALFAPPRPICIKCYQSELEWVELKGQGELAAFSCISIGPGFMIQEGYNRKNPYCVGVINLEEGVRVDARIEGVNPSHPEDITVGTPMQVKFLHKPFGTGKRTYLAFQPLE